MASPASPRKPLCERSAQCRNQRATGKGEAPRKRTYGKGGRASSRTVMRDFFMDENEINTQLSKVSLGAVPPISPPSLSVSTADVKSNLPSPRLSCPPRGDQSNIVLELEKPSVDPLAPLLAESHKSREVCEFSGWTARVTESFKVVKVSEGSYGEVYKLRRKGNRDAGDAYYDSIFKLLPIKEESNKASNLTHLDGLIREVKILKRMDAIPGFVRFRDLTVLRGASPLAFIEAWEHYAEANKDKDLKPDHPSIYSEHQLWAMLEMGDCGTELEALGNLSIYQSFDIFWSTCVALSLGEELAEFEHRDLHISNLCVKSAQSSLRLDTSINVNQSGQSQQPCKTCFGHSGLRTSIIDFGFSRAQCGDQQNPTVIYDPTHSLSVLKQRGRTTLENLQNATYNKVYQHVVEAERQARRQDRSMETRRFNKWERFLPKTNVLWLEYLLRVMLCSQVEAKDANGLLEKLPKQMKRLLEMTLDLLVGKGMGGKAPNSARGIIELARKEDLLTEEDVMAIKQSLEGS